MEKSPKNYGKTPSQIERSRKRKARLMKHSLKIWLNFLRKKDTLVPKKIIEDRDVTGLSMVDLFYITYIVKNTNEKQSNLSKVRGGIRKLCVQGRYCSKSQTELDLIFMFLTFVGPCTPRLESTVQMVLIALRRSVLQTACEIAEKPVSDIDPEVKSRN